MVISEVKKTEMEQAFHFVRKTFIDTYSIHNTPENMQIYLTQNLSEEQLSKEYDSPNCLFYKGIKNEQIAGYLKLNINDAQTDKADLNAIEIERIYVDQSFHKMGFGAQLVSYSKEIGRNLSKSYLWLGVWNKNENVIGFYKKMGFETFDTHDFKLGDELQTDFLMKLGL